MPLPRGRNESELERLFPGDSEMAGRMRALDWSKTPLGPITDWPHSLKTAVHIMLSSRYPMFVWWGRKLINLYNDAYMPIPGKRHPDALGRPAAEVWSDIWYTVGPQAEAVLSEGRATWSEELLLVMERNQFLEETYFTYSYSPIPDDEGGVGGVFCARRILVVDDNRDSAESLAMLLKLTGNETHTAYDGLEAVKAAAMFKPEVVLLDIGLPKMNGFEAARKIRAEAWGKTMVLVALTGWGQEEDREKSREAGFDGHLVKPVDHAALTKLLAELGVG